MEEESISAKETDRTSTSCVWQQDERKFSTYSIHLSTQTGVINSVWMRGVCGRGRAVVCYQNTMYF